MRIFCKIFERGDSEPYKLDISGKFAIETLLIKLVEKYFGTEIKNKFEDLIKERSND